MNERMNAIKIKRLWKCDWKKKKCAKQIRTVCVRLVVDNIFFYWLRTFFSSCLVFKTLFTHRNTQKKGNNDIFTIAYNSNETRKITLTMEAIIRISINKWHLVDLKFHILKYWTLEFPNELETGAMCARKELEINFEKKIGKRLWIVDFSDFIYIIE